MRIFISAPYSQGDVACNVGAAIAAADLLMDLGHVVFCPHLSHLQHLCHPRPYEEWLAHDIEWLKVCEALVRLPGPSAGADGEVAWATDHNIPVYDGLPAFVREVGPDRATYPTGVARWVRVTEVEEG